MEQQSRSFLLSVRIDRLAGTEEGCNVQGNCIASRKPGDGWNFGHGVYSQRECHSILAGYLVYHHQRRLKFLLGLMTLRD